MNSNDMHNKGGKALPCQFILFHKEAGVEIPEISAFYALIRNTKVLFLITAFI